jgi:hypothetical protein
LLEVILVFSFVLLTAFPSRPHKKQVRAEEWV